MSGIDDGEVYTVDRETFARIYRPVSPGIFEKVAPEWAAVAAQPGRIATREGITQYEAGAYLVYNVEDDKDSYAVGPETFGKMHERRLASLTGPNGVCPAGLWRQAAGWPIVLGFRGFDKKREGMATITDISIIDSNTAKAKPVESGTERTLCSPALCGSKNLTVYRRTVSQGKRFDVQAGNDYHLVYVMAPGRGTIHFASKAHEAEEGAGVLLQPGEAARFEASGSSMELLHMIVPKPPAAVEAGLPGGTGYFFDRKSLRALSDASGGRIRRFCAESSVRLKNGSRLTSTNAIQAGEMHYMEGGGSPYHLHKGTDANPDGPDHCYMTFKGRGVVEVENEFRELEPGTLVYFPPGVPHRLRSHGGPLDYFEIQAWRSFNTMVLSEEPLGLKWYYERESPNEERVEWNQS